MGEYISRALSPAKVIAVMLNPEEKSAKAIVEDDNFAFFVVHLVFYEFFLYFVVALDNNLLCSLRRNS